MPKFELYNHNELFNIYYGIFYELWTFAYFDRLCKLEKRGDEIKKNFSSETTEPISSKLCWNDPWVVPFQILSISAVLYPRWPPLLKIEISSNGQNGSILTQKVPKFELYNHNELFNIYYGIFYELWTFAYFDRLCKLEKGGMKLKKIFSSETTEPISSKLCWNGPWVVPFQNCVVSAVLYPRWPPLLKIEISSNGQNCSILSQKVPKFELYNHNDELFNIYYRIFYELWTFAYFDRLCKLEKRGMQLKKKFSSETTEPISTKLCWNDPWVVPFENCVRQRSPVSKMAAITKNRNFFKWPKLLYFKPESAQIWTV